MYICCLYFYIRLDKILCSFRQNFPFLFSVTEKALKTESKTEIEKKIEKFWREIDLKFN